MYAFDLDGVLVPDFDRIPMLGGLSDFYSFTEYIQPIFVPAGEYVIITGRPARYRHFTVAWSRQRLPNSPVRIYHELVDESPEAYKAAILNSVSDITHYVESDIRIVEHLKRNVRTDCEIIHFSTFLANQLNANR